jgi:photosystem II stability/assembly factor-like uncharacterized protein
MASYLYAGTDKGVVTLKSRDGRSWELAHQTLQDWAVPKIAVDPAAPNRVLAGTRGDGVWVSEDFGATWKKPCYGKPGPGKVRSITLDPRDSRTVYAGGEPIDVYVSEDLGASWDRLDSVRKLPWVEQVTYPVAVVEPHVRDIAIDPADPRNMYLALQVGAILRSKDGGSNWEVLDRRYDSDVHTILIDPDDPSTIRIATGGHDMRQGKSGGRALFMTEDGGESWAPLAMTFSQEYSVPLTMHPTNHDILFSSIAHGQPNSWRTRDTGAESRIIRSKDGGKSWEALEQGLDGVAQNFAECIVFDEQHPDRVYAALRNGSLYASMNGGDSWEKLDLRISAPGDMKCVNAD